MDEQRIKELNNIINTAKEEIKRIYAESKREKEKEKEASLNMSITLAQKPFLSLEGESLRVGTPVIFLRFWGCNLRCRSNIYPNCRCDSEYSFKNSETICKTTIGELIKEIERMDCKNIAITGGEPLLHMKEIYWLLYNLSEENEYSYDRTSKYDITIETNGSIDFSPIKENFGLFTHIIGDWKCEGAFGKDAHSKMIPDLLYKYGYNDALKFVVTKEDLPEVKRVLTEYPGIDKKTNIYLSPAWGCIDIKDIVNWIIDHREWRVRLSLQTHKLFEVTKEDLVKIGEKSANNIWL